MGAFDKSFLVSLRGRKVSNIDAESANILGIYFEDGSMVEFEVEHLGNNLYGNQIRRYKVADCPESVVADILKEPSIAARCLECGDTIESTHLHDFNSCSCGNVSLDGGTDCPRILSKGGQFEMLND
jgi:hypothetical protein